MPEDTCRWLCTCLCENYLDMVNKVLFVVGVIFFIFACWMCFMDPLSDPSLDSMKQLGDLSKTKWAAFAAGPLIMIAACLGISFAKNNSRAVGCGYMVCIVVALILQFAVVSIATGGILSDIEDLAKVSMNYESGEKTKEAEKLEKQMADQGKAEAISKTFRTWGKRWNNPDNEAEGGTDGDWKCSFTDAPAPAPAPPPAPDQDPATSPGQAPAPDQAPAASPGQAPAPDQTPAASPGQAPAPDQTPAASPGQAPAPDQIPAPGLAADPSPSPEPSPASGDFISMVERSRRLQETKDKCKAEKREVKCESAPNTFAQKTSDYCMAKAGHEKEFTAFCSGCVEKWWDMWKMEKHNEEDGDNAIAHLKEKFEGDPGAAYCRCMSRFVDSIQRHYPKIKLVCNILAILELILLGSTIWLLMCGPDPEESTPEIEMNLGQQPASGSPQRQTVICPENALPGTPVMVTTNDGRMMQAIVPEGVGPGMPFQIEV